MRLRKQRKIGRKQNRRRNLNTFHTGWKHSILSEQERLGQRRIQHDPATCKVFFGRKTRPEAQLPRAPSDLSGLPTSTPAGRQCCQGRRTRRRRIGAAQIAFPCTPPSRVATGLMPACSLSLRCRRPASMPSSAPVAEPRRSLREAASSGGDVARNAHDPGTRSGDRLACMLKSKVLIHRQVYDF